MTEMPQSHTPKPSLRAQWTSLLEEQPKLRIRNAALILGVSEAELLATQLGETVHPLNGAWSEILEGLEEVGDVMALTRNNHAVHEKHGVYRNVSIDGPIGLVLDEEIDLRLFMHHWYAGFVVQQPLKSGWRRSLQFFNRYGQAVHKIFATEHTDQDAWNALVDRHRCAEPPVDLEWSTPPEQKAETP
ncbi:MAG: ChuX/HutX family heme-like substrate-binding protein, partial [Myxococcota bacterium]